MEPWELLAREAIRETLAAYALLVDAGRLDDVVLLFAPEAVLEVETADGAREVRGRAALRELFAGVGDDLAARTGAPRIRHHCSAPSIEVLGVGEAVARSCFLALTDRGVDHWGRYLDRLVPSDERWGIAHRRVRTDGVVPGGWAAARLGVTGPASG